MDNLAVFDIDGTLIRHLAQGNDRSYVRAFEEVFNITGIVDDPQAWSSFKTSTDSGITCEIYRMRYGRDPLPVELDNFKGRELALLEGEFRSGELKYEALPGAGEILGLLGKSFGWDVAIATGNWEYKGRMKLDSAGVANREVPMGAAEDGIERAVIIMSAIGRARKARGASGYGKTVFIGDRPWDINAARLLGLPFLGIGSGADAEELLREGARAVIDGYSRPDEVAKALENSSV